MDSFPCFFFSIEAMKTNQVTRINTVTVFVTVTVTVNVHVTVTVTTVTVGAKINIS